MFIEQPMILPWYFFYRINDILVFVLRAEQIYFAKKSMSPKFFQMAMPVLQLERTALLYFY